MLHTISARKSRDGRAGWRGVAAAGVSGPRTPTRSELRLAADAGIRMQPATAAVPERAISGSCRTSKTHRGKACAARWTSGDHGHSAEALRRRSRSGVAAPGRVGRDGAAELCRWAPADRHVAGLLLTGEARETGCAGPNRGPRRDDQRRAVRTPLRSVRPWAASRRRARAGGLAGHRRRSGGLLLPLLRRGLVAAPVSGPVEAPAPQPAPCPAPPRLPAPPLVIEAERVPAQPIET